MPHARRDQPISFGARQAFGNRFQFVDIDEATDARAHVAALQQRRALRKRVVSSLQINRQNPDARRQRQITDHRLEISHLSVHRARAFGKDQRVVAAIEIRARVSQRLPQRSTALHRHQVCKVLHVGAFVFRVEEIIGRGQGDEIFARVVERHLHQTHVEV